MRKPLALLDVLSFEWEFHPNCTILVLLDVVADARGHPGVYCIVGVTNACKTAVCQSFGHRVRLLNDQSCVSLWSRYEGAPIGVVVTAGTRHAGGCSMPCL